MIHSRTKNITMILTLLLIIVFVAGTIFRIRISKQLEHVQSLRVMIAESNDTTNVVVIKRLTEDIETYQSVLRSYLIDSEKNIEFIEGIESLGNELDLDLSVQNIETKDAMANRRVQGEDGTQTITDIRSHGVLSMNVNARGSWQSVMKLLLLFENYPKYLLVENIRLTLVPGSQTSAQEWATSFSIRGLTN